MECGVGQLLGVFQVQGNGLVAEFVEEVGAPVPLQPGRVERIEQAVQHREGDRPGHIHRRRAKFPNRFEDFLGLVDAAGVAPGDHAHLLQVVLARGTSGRAGWSQSQTSRSDPPGRSRSDPARTSAPSRHARETRRSGRRRPCRPVRPWNRKEVTTPKLPPPPRTAQNRSGFCSCVGSDKAPVGQNHVHAQQVVDGQAVFACQVARSRRPGTAHPHRWRR